MGRHSQQSLAPPAAVSNTEAPVGDALANLLVELHQAAQAHRDDRKKGMENALVAVLRFLTTVTGVEGAALRTPLNDLLSDLNPHAGNAMSDKEALDRAFCVAAIDILGELCGVKPRAAAAELVSEATGRKLTKEYLLDHYKNLLRKKYKNAACDHYDLCLNEARKARKAKVSPAEIKEMTLRQVNVLFGVICPTK
jgi:hypothetical protein